MDTIGKSKEGDGDSPLGLCTRTCSPRKPRQGAGEFLRNELAQGHFSAALLWPLSPSCGCCFALSLSFPRAACFWASPSSSLWPLFCTHERQGEGADKASSSFDCVTKRRAALQFRKRRKEGAFPFFPGRRVRGGGGSKYMMEN